jgi:hypothetical protein
MKNIGTGHYIFAAIFVVVFLGGMVWAYRSDLKRIGVHYRRLWLLILLMLVVYFTIFFLNRAT